MEDIRRRLAQNPTLPVGANNSKSRTVTPPAAQPTVYTISDDDDRAKSIVARSRTGPAQPIHIPSNADLPHNDPSRATGHWETSHEGREDLQDLLQQSFDGKEDGEVAHDDIDMSKAIVEGFREGIRLLPHQVVGRDWMAERESGKKYGGILADDMGLGKTIQTLTRIVDGRPRKSDGDDGWAATTLVICPVSLVSQWASEISKMAKKLTVIEHHGASRTTNPETLRRAHIVVTSYAIVASEHSTFQPKSKDESKSKKGSSSKTDSSSDTDSEADHFGRTLGSKKVPSTTKSKKKDALFKVRWWRIVLDEAHNIKNRNTKAAQACCALEGKYRWCLTGTPLQNNVEELYSLLKFLRIKPLNDWQTFNEQINKPVKSGRSIRAMKRLHVVLRAIMLRRRKTDDERQFYFALENKVEEAMQKFMKNNEVMKNYTNVMVLLLRLRQACNHPSLVTKDYNVDREAIESRPAPKDDHEDEELTTMFQQLGVSKGKKCQLCQDELTPENIAKDGEHCNDCRELSQNARRKSLSRAKGSDLPPDSAKIRKILDMSKDKREISLNQIKSNNTGLNLTACNNVILVDLWWNPALEDQAFDRAHRLGKHLTIEKTVEERILALQNSKRALTAAALSGDRLKNLKLGLEDLMALFRPGREDYED
ncbi:SNF2 family N-terminal domain-containing protein [Lactifluus volemus]|nr:SNF2 family N-terminal domain-containing protein [Lactifluus volemus]